MFFLFLKKTYLIDSWKSWVQRKCRNQKTNCIYVQAQKSSYFLKSHVSSPLTDGKQFEEVYWMKQPPSEQSRDMSDVNETGEIFKSPGLSPRNHGISTRPLLGRLMNQSSALRIDSINTISYNDDDYYLQLAPASQASVPGRTKRRLV